MAEIEDKVILEQLREGKILEENIITDVHRMYLQLKKAGDSIQLLDVFVNRGYLSSAQVQQIFNQNNTKALQKIGDYNILKKLGSGGMGSVFLAQKDKSTALVAIKVLPRSSNQNDKIISRFNREFRALHQLKHPAIISGIEKGFAGGYHFYVMEFFEGQTIKSYVEKNKPVDFTKAVEIIRGVAVGLQYASGQGMIHRDIKPENIIITDDNQIKIIDFGLVKIENETGMNLTRTQTAMGTPYFISCEQAKNAKEADLRSDIYSLGATLFYLVTADYPVKGTTAYEVLAALISGKVEKPKNINPNIPDALNQLILNMMAMNMEDRYQNYETLLADIDLYLKGSKIKALIPGQTTSLNKKSFKKYIYAGVLLTIVGLISIFIFHKKPEAPPVKEEPPKNDIVLDTPSDDVEPAVESQKEFIKYRIVNSFDREYKRKESLGNHKDINTKLDSFLLYLSNHEIDESGTKAEKLLTRAFVLLAFCGAGYDFYQGQDLKMMEEYLKYIVDAQIEPGKWSSDLWVNVICTNAIIESFAMYGSDNEELSNLSIDSLNQIENQSKSFSFLPVEENILGSHLYITAFTFSRIAGLPKFNKLKEDQIAMIRKSTLARILITNTNKPGGMLDRLDLEAISEIIGKLRDNELFLNQLKEKNFIAKSSREAYFLILFYGISRDKKEKQWLLDSAMQFFNSKQTLTNEVSQYKEINGTIITYSIAALAIENIYRIPYEAILRGGSKREGKLRNIILNK